MPSIRSPQAPPALTLREMIFKILRWIVFPFRLVYLMIYEQRLNRLRRSRLAARAEQEPAPPADVTPD